MNRHPLEMTPLWQRLTATLVTVVIGIPVTFAATIALMPVWSKIEARYGIESVGHSGPSDWCFGLVFGVYLCVAAMVGFGLRTSARRS
jgi:hypothetical protein